MKSSGLRYVVASALIATVLAGTAGCGEKSEAELVASAKDSLAKNDSKAAIVQLKTALQKSPQSGEARYLLGKTLLDGGDLQAAMIELGKAADAHFDPNLLMPTTARVKLATGQVKYVTEQYGGANLTDPAAAAELKSIVALAYYVQGDADRSQTQVEASLKLDPRNASARVQQARLSARRGAFDEAITRLDALIAEQPKMLEAWLLKGEVLWGGKKDLDGAVKAFRQALVIEPRTLGAHEALIRLLEEKGDRAGVKAQVEQLQKDLPNSLEARFHGAQQSVLNGELGKAREAVDQLLRDAPGVPRILELAGGVELQSGSVGPALKHLSQALQGAPDSGVARGLLAQAQLQSAQPADALRTLQPLLSVDKPGADALNLAAQAHMQNGEIDKAVSFYERAAATDPKDAGARVALALTKVIKGDAAEAAAGFAALESLAASDKGTVADLALINARIARNDFPAALKDVDRLQAKTPNEPLPPLLRGRIMKFGKDADGARAAFDKALALDPSYFPALAELATLDMAQNKIPQALARYEPVLAKDPKNYRLILAVAYLRQQAGAKPEEIEPLLVEALKANPDEPVARLALIEHRLAQNHAKDALVAAQEAVAAIPANAQLQAALGNAQLASGDSQQAIATFKRMAGSQTTPNPEPYLRLAQIYAGAKDYAAAILNLNQALAVAPRLLVAEQALVDIAIARKRMPDALEVARKVQKERPQEAAGYLMEAGIQVAQKAWDPAIAATRQALERERTTATAVRLHGLYLAAGRQAEADRVAAAWRRDRPDDLDFLFYLGSVAMDRKDYPAAEARYREILAVRPDHAPTLNNVAWLLVLQGKPGAVAMAERASKLAPDEPSFLDTMSRALAADKQAAPALDWARKAVAKAPDRPEYRLNLARLMIQAGERTQAKEELQKLAALGGRFGNQAEVATLLNGL